MDLILNLVVQIIPLLVLVSIGFVSGRFLDVNLHSVAILAIYVVAPFVNFGAMAQFEFQDHYLILPIYMFCVSSMIGIVTYRLSSFFWKGDNTANLISMTSVTGNTGYFGIPIVLFLLGPEWLGIYLFMNLGAFLNEISLGYYFGARGHANVKGAIIKIFKLPVIYGIAAGVLYNVSGLDLPDTITKYWNHAVGTWIIIGMMIIGIALSKQSRLEIDNRLMMWMFIPRFVVWPLFGLLFIIFDMHYVMMFDKDIYLLVGIFTLVPLAGNTVAFASTLKLHPEKAAMCVLLATVFALIYMPLCLYILQGFINS